ncbi:MAG: GNAT family N-acetyltransferase [Asgard group archaeon]|nr:GNAT family N-acetyltransferase [Asgard group archaeon]
MFKLTKEQASKFLRDRLNKKMVFIALYMNEVVGFIAMKDDFLWGNYIRRIVVREDLRGNNIGSQLMRYVENITFSNNLPNVYLICSVTNTDAVRFYQKEGYEIIGEVKDFIDVGLHEYIFRKTIGPVKKFTKYD